MNSGEGTITDDLGSVTVFSIIKVDVRWQKVLGDEAFTSRELFGRAITQFNQKDSCADNKESGITSNMPVALIGGW